MRILLCTNEMRILLCANEMIIVSFQIIILFGANDNISLYKSEISSCK